MKNNSLFLLLIVLLVFSCKKDDETTTSDKLILTENTVILEDEQRDDITSVSTNEVVFTKGNTTLDAFQVGDIIVTGVSDFAPTGFLRRVTSVNETDTEIILGTSHANLTDAIEECNIKIERAISPDDFRDYEIEVELDLGDNVPVTGVAEIALDILFDFDIKDSNVEYAKIGLGVDYELAAEIEVSSAGNYAVEKELLEKDLKPITILIGGVFPLVITPDLELLGGFEFEGPFLNVNYKLKGGSVDYYTLKNTGGWSPHKDVIKPTATVNGLSGSLEAGFEVYLKPALELEFYDRDEVETLFYIKQSVIGEASFDTSEGFDCELHYGISLGGEVNVAILGFTANPSIEAEFLKLSFYKCPENGLIDSIGLFITDTILNVITDQLDIPIHEGLNPPNIEGTFLVSPNALFSTNIPDDPDIGYIFDDATITFSNQNQQDLTVRVSEEQGSGFGNGDGSYILGEGNKFSVFSEINEYSDVTGYSTLARVYSGEISQDGIINFHCALLMLDDHGDPSGTLIEIGQGRGFIDSNGFSPKQ